MFFLWRWQITKVAYVTLVLQVCQHPHLSMRTWGAEAVTSLTKAALAHKFEPPLHEQPVSIEQPK